jgi:hypothetical protein
MAAGGGGAAFGSAASGGGGAAVGVNIEKSARVQELGGEAYCFELVDYAKANGIDALALVEFGGRCMPIGPRPGSRAPLRREELLLGRAAWFSTRGPAGQVRRARPRWG